MASETESNLAGFMWYGNSSEKGRGGLHLSVERLRRGHQEGEDLRASFRGLRCLDEHQEPEDAGEETELTYSRRAVGHFKGARPVSSKTPPEKLRAALNKEWERFIDVRTKYSCGLATKRQFEGALDRLKLFQKRAGLKMLVSDEELRDTERPLGALFVGQG